LRKRSVRRYGGTFFTFLQRVLFASVNTRSPCIQSLQQIIIFVYFIFCHIFVTQLCCTFLHKACDSCLCSCLYKVSVLSCLLSAMFVDRELNSCSCLNKTSVCYSIKYLSDLVSAIVFYTRLVFPVPSTILVSTQLVSPVILFVCARLASPVFLFVCARLVSPGFVLVCATPESLVFVFVCTKLVSPVFVLVCAKLVSLVFLSVYARLSSPVFILVCAKPVSPLFVLFYTNLVSPAFVPVCTKLVSTFLYLYLQSLRLLSF
jgi:hypothetical protein